MKMLKLGYIPALTGIRGVAVLLVICAHAQVPFVDAGGGIGVNIFFVLSGFLITGFLIQEWEHFNNIDFKKFYMRRILRLLPALSFLLIIYCLAVLMFFHDKTKYFTDVLIVLFYAANWVRAAGYDRPYHLGHTWSLSIEEQFYVLWPFLLSFMMRHLKSWASIFKVTLAGLLASYAFRTILFARGASIMRVYNGLDTRADSLLMGCVLAILFSSGWIPDNKSTKDLIRYLSTASVFALLAMVFIPGTAFFSHRYFLYSIFSALIILALTTDCNAALKRFFEVPFLTYTGKISYGLYLWHFLVLSALTTFNLQWYILLPLVTASSFVIASASYYFIEQHFLRLKISFVKKYPVCANTSCIS